MMGRCRGRIVNVSSIAATRGARTGHADYAASKGAVVSLTRSLALRLGPYNITVNAIAPGVIRTDMTRQALVEREALVWVADRAGGSAQPKRLPRPYCS